MRRAKKALQGALARLATVASQCWQGPRDSPLLTFLYRIKAVDSPDCELCRQPETVEHYLLLCRRYQGIRRDLPTTSASPSASTGQNTESTSPSPDLPEIFSTPLPAPPLLLPPTPPQQPLNNPISPLNRTPSIPLLRNLDPNPPLTLTRQPYLTPQPLPPKPLARLPALPVSPVSSLPVELDLTRAAQALLMRAGVYRLTLPETSRGLANPLQEHHPAPKKVRPTLPVWRGRTGSNQLGEDRNSPLLLSPTGLVLSSPFLSLFRLSPGHLFSFSLFHFLFSPSPPEQPARSPQQLAGSGRARDLGAQAGKTCRPISSPGPAGWNGRQHTCPLKGGRPLRQLAAEVPARYPERLLPAILSSMPSDLDVSDGGELGIRALTMNGSRSHGVA
ncbi:hypothetical protein CROQUDRAFT_94692 [Cronartium quercuum f. sp. fusiforme G11]|uniref:Reverse transcriptase zinc-binding domain-containing protein n=1 Tax=Cronartium quercuum f. sp. fusiforme G11 TaxID=708437 RepID=A0A9P6NIR5_9BASI|nr:hypothetical protein CROQUDRAFT_94692 [Cronartium quercuum f. sp. fusiforme G11]